jgi:hypothetical protein
LSVLSFCLLFSSFFVCLLLISSDKFRFQSPRHCLVPCVPTHWLKVSTDLSIRVARFFVLQYTKTRENVPKDHQITQRKYNIPNGHNIFQMVIKYANIFHFKVLQNSPKFVVLVWK